ARNTGLGSVASLIPAQCLHHQPSQPAAFRFLLHADRHARRALPAISKGNESASPARQRLSPIAGQLLIALVVLAVFQNGRNSIGYIEWATKHCSPEWKCPLKAAEAATFAAAYDRLATHSKPDTGTRRYFGCSGVYVEIVGAVPLTGSTFAAQNR